jgi:hypothetical protein
MDWGASVESLAAHVAQGKLQGFAVIALHGNCGDAGQFADRFAVCFERRARCR